MIKKLYSWVLGDQYRLYFGESKPEPQQPTTQTVQQTNLPAWAQPYSEQLLGKAQALTDINQNPYQSYQGQRLADFTPMQQQAFQNIGSMQVSPQTGQATGLAGMAGLGSLGAGANYMGMATDPRAMQAFMSPYQQNVTDWQKQQAIMDYGRQLPGIGASASQAGAFGGTRHALVESEAQRNLQNQLAGIQAQGSQNAFNAAQQAQQYGAGLNLQGFGQAGQLASTIGQLGQQQYGQQMGINAAQQQAGAQQQALQQQQLTNQYQDFLNRQNYPYQQLAFMSDILHGTPTGGITTQQQYQAAPSMWSNIAGVGQLGMGIGALGKSGLFGKEGGSVPGGLKRYAEGGPIGGIASQLRSPTFSAGVDYETKAAQQGQPTLMTFDDLRQLNELKNAMQQSPAQPSETSVAQDIKGQFGIAGLSAPNLDTAFMANGGIIAFAGEGPSLVGEALSVEDLDDLQRQRVINERIAARDAARAAAEAAGKPPVLETIGSEDIALNRAKQQAADRLSKARGAGLGATPEAAVAGKTAADLEIEKALGKPKSGIASVAAEAPKPPISAGAGAAESAVAGAAEKQAANRGLWSLVKGAGKAGWNTLGGINRFGGHILGVGAPLALYSSDVGEGSYLPAATSTPTKAQIDNMYQSGQITDAERIGLYNKYIVNQSNVNSWEEITALGETGNRQGNPAQITKDSNESRSYGTFGLNSKGGKNSTVGKFAAMYPELGLKGEPGSPMFNKRWELAAREKPAELKAAMNDYANKTFYNPTQDNLSKILPADIAKDKRVGAYFADRAVHYGVNSTSNDAEVIKNAWGDAKGDVNKFFANMNSYDFEHRKERFKTAYDNKLMTDEGFQRRLDIRTKGASDIGAPAGKPTPASPSSAPPAPSRIPASVKEKITNIINPDEAGKKATETLVVDSSGNAVPVSQDKPDDTKNAADNARLQLEANAAERALKNAKDAQARGDKESADKWFNIGMALLASGSATLSAGKQYAMQNIGAGLGAGVSTFAELSKQDRAEKIRRQQMAETQRKDLAAEAIRLRQNYTTSAIAKAKTRLPDFGANSSKDDLATQIEMLNHDLTMLDPAHQEALYGPNAVAIISQRLAEAEKLLKGAGSAGAGKQDTSGFGQMTVR